VPSRCFLIVFAALLGLSAPAWPQASPAPDGLILPTATTSTSLDRMRAELNRRPLWLPQDVPSASGARLRSLFFSASPTPDLPQFAPSPTLDFQPGSPFNPGASGPGSVSRNDRVAFLGGTFDPRSGWPVVILDHFKPDPERMRAFWTVNTYDCPQELDPSGFARVRYRKFQPDGSVRDFAISDLQAQAASARTVFIQVHGNLTYADANLGAGLWTHTWMQLNGGIPEDAVFVAFAWPSWRTYNLDFRDVEEKARRSYVAGLYLAQLVQSLPPGTNVCLFGQSYGGRVVLAALELLGGGAIDTQSGDAPVCLTSSRPDLHVRAIILSAAVDNDWIAPGKRFGRALFGCEALLNLYNPRDQALVLYPLLLRSGHRPALGRTGLPQRAFDRLGPMAARYAEHDVTRYLGRDHTLLDATASPDIARWMAPYAWAPGPDGLAPSLTAQPRPRGVVTTIAPDTTQVIALDPGPTRQVR
jgi:hypothetical protein